jgi:hypothetical protein
MTTAKPVQKIRAGQVSCALWENELRVNGGSRTVKTLKANGGHRVDGRDGEAAAGDRRSRT